jgi:hypothetical protein
MAAPVADLHVHTTVSDGTLRLEDLPAIARAADLEWVAVTDHDRVHPGLEAPVTDHGGVRVVRGVELKVDTGGERLDLLGYGVDPTPALRAELDRLQQDRIERGRAIVGCVERRLGVELDLEVGEGTGRPHVARAIADHPGTEYDYAGAFEHVVGDDCPCYVARKVTGLEEGVRLLSESCAVVGLAHPFRYDDPASALEVARRLDAVERYYPYGPGDAVDESLLGSVVEAADLLVTGGSDAHDRTLGLAGLDEAGLRPFAERLAGA